MKTSISVAELWPQLAQGRVLIDVRSPSEYAHGHIPEAVSMPLFSDEERAKVGTLYKQVSPESALLKGLDFVGPKMSGFVKWAKKLAPDRLVIVHCWRGGQRSGSIAWLLRLAGFDVVTLQGGYKAYRNYILEQFAIQPKHIIILGGRTGVGKTIILHELTKQGQQVIDLERLAHHKGSAFGWIGEQNQPSVEYFENQLFSVFRQIDPERIVWVENESRAIGTVFIPEPFWEQMKKAPLVNVILPIEARIAHLVQIYTQESKADLVASFQKISRKLNDKLRTALEALDRDDYTAAAEIALKYYDKTYQHGLDESTAPHILNLEADALHAPNIAKKLVALVNQTTIGTGKQ